MFTERFSNATSFCVPGPDLTSLMIGLAPQLLSAATGSSGTGSAAAALLPVLAPALGSILGGSGGSARPNIDRNPSVGGSGGGGGAGLTSLIGPALGAILGGAGGGGGSSRPQKPSPQQFFRQPPPTPPPQTTTEAPETRPECPGTCIGSYLSFTCFGNLPLRFRSRTRNLFCFLD